MQFQRPVPPPEWGDVFHQPDLPLVIDIGCGPGRFLLKLASSDSSQWSGDAAEHGRDFNFLGLEIREPIVERARKWSDKLGVGHRVAFMKVNATLHMASLL